MGGYIGANSGTLLSNAAERKQTYTITTATTSLTGLAYTPTKVHVFHNGVRLVDGTDYTATNGTSITLTNAAQNGDEVVVISYPSFQTSDTVSAANGGTFAGNVTMSSDLNVDTIKNTSGTTAMTIDSSGRILKPTTPHFHVTKTDGHVGASTTIVWNNKVRDTENAYSTSTGKYTIPSGLTGLWWFGVSGLAQNTDIIEITMKNNGTGVFNARDRDDGNTTSSSGTINAAYYVTAGDELLITTEANSSMYGTGSEYSFWTGYFIG